MCRLRYLLVLVVASLAAVMVRADTAALPLQIDAQGRVLLDVRNGSEWLYFNALATGFGATVPLLDRGQLGDEALVRFERHGNRVVLIRSNPGFRAIDGDSAQGNAAAQSFPRAVLAAFEIVSEQAGTLRVDASDFLLDDVMNLARAMEQAGRGKFTLDRSRSYVDAAESGAFARNTEARAVLTFSVKDGDLLFEQHAPDARAVTFEVQHSFLALPEAGYQPRDFHPRAGIFPHLVFDFSQGLESDYRRRWIWRWRLVPSDREAYLRGELVEPEQPIVYYLDPAIPEPYRSAFREGGLWFNALLEAAGFRDAFQIHDLPEGASPLDARYNVVMWVHRSERGPSVGPSQRDLRTGEIVRTIVRMDSYRSLVNHDIWMGFLPAAGPAGLALDSEAMAMARRRQHAAHEIGHTLGLAHNFIAASQDRASVMDYPVPLVHLDTDGGIDLSAAYAPGPGDFDRFAIRYAYTWYPDAETEREGLAAILAEADAAGLRFLTGGDAGPGGSVPPATTWVEGNTMAEALQRTVAVRARLLNAFDARALAPGEPYWFLNKRLAHVYLHHRTALQGAIKTVGGLDYHYALYGEGVLPTQAIPADEQRAVLRAVLETLSPGQLQVPERALQLIPPVPSGWDSSRKWSGENAPISSDSGPVLTERFIAHSLAQEITDALLLPARVNRAQELPASELIASLLAATWGVAPDAEALPLQLVAQRAVLDSLLDLAGHADTAALVRAVAEWHLAELQGTLAARPGRSRGGNTLLLAHRASAERDIARYFAGEDAPGKRPRPAPIALPWP